MERHAKTKRSLTPSILMIVMCLALLIGTTFAWFTDTASTSVNKIEAGKLDVELYSADNTTGTEEDTTWTKITSETPALEFVKAAEDENEPVLWEPGCTYSLPALKIVNNGNLAIKYTIAISGIKGSEKLNDAIEWTMKLGGNDETIGTEHILAAKPADATQESADIFTISGHMKEDAGNEYQGEFIDGISIVVYATQAAVEYDSSNNTYDEEASYKIPNEIKNNETLAIAAGTVTLPTSDTSGAADISGNNITISGAGENATTLVVPKVGYTIDGSNVTLKGLTIEGAKQTEKNSKALVLSGDNTTLENVTVNATEESDETHAIGVYIKDIEKNNTVKIANSTIGTNGWIALKVEKVGGTLSIKDSTLSASGENGYCLSVINENGLVKAENTKLEGTVLFGKNFSGTATFEKCDFAGTVNLGRNNNNVKVTFNNCTYKGEAVSEDTVEKIMPYLNNSTVTVNGDTVTVS